MPPDTHDRTGPVDPPALAALDVNGNRTFRVSRITVTEGKKLVLGPDDQAFLLGSRSDNQYPSRHTFVVLERVDPDA